MYMSSRDTSYIAEETQMQFDLVDLQPSSFSATHYPKFFLSSRLEVVTCIIQFKLSDVPGSILFLLLSTKYRHNHRRLCIHSELVLYPR